jgi:lysophospholipase L1-like esterase
MKVTMLTTVPGGSAYGPLTSGTSYELPYDYAKSLVDAGSAKYTNAVVPYSNPPDTVGPTAAAAVAAATVVSLESIYRRLRSAETRAKGRNVFDTATTSAATITAVANASITNPSNPVTYTCTSDNNQGYFKYTGVNGGVRDWFLQQNFFGYNKCFGPRTSSSQTQGSTHVGGCVRKFRTDAPYIVVKVAGTSVPYRVAIDGQWASTDLVQTTNGAIQIDFSASRADREIAIYAEQSGAFGDVVIGNTDTLFKVVEDTPRVVLTGDSHTAGSSPDATSPNVSMHLTIPGVMREISGCNVISLGLGGTGWITASSSMRFDDPARVADEALANPDALFIEGGVNDLKIDLATQQASSAAVKASVVTGLTLRRTAMPNVPIVVLDAHPGNKNQSAMLLQLCADIRDGVAQYISNTGDRRVAFITQNIASASVGPWITGTYTTSSTSGTAGNSRILVSNDGIHSSVVGNVTLGRKWWAEFMEALRVMAGLPA